MTRSSIAREFCAVVALSLLSGTAFAQGSPAELDQRLGQIEKQLTGLLDEIKTLRQELKEQDPAEKPAPELRIFALKYIEAGTVAPLLQELLGGDQASAFRCVADLPTNQLIVLGTMEQLDQVEALLVRLDKQQDARKEAEAQLTLAQAEVEQRRDRAAWSERMAARGFITPQQVEADRVQLRQAEAELELAKQRLGDLAEPTEPK